MVHVREIDGKPLRFGHSGKLWHDAYLLYDEGTGSLWHHLTGTAMAGPLRGRSLRRLPTAFTTWGAWRREHPGTLVLRTPAPERPADRPADRDGYAERNARLRFGYAVDVAGASRLHPLDDVAAVGLVEGTLAGVPYVVVSDAPGVARAPGGDPGSAHAFDRRVSGRTLSFRVDAGGPDGRPVLRPVVRPGDPADGRAWFARSGLAVPGSGASAGLVRLTGSVWAVRAWELQHRPATPAPGPAPAGRER